MLTAPLRAPRRLPAAAPSPKPARRRYEAFKEHGSEAELKAVGKMRTQGKLYEIVDGDVCYFKHNS